VPVKSPASMVHAYQPRDAKRCGQDSRLLVSRRDLLPSEHSFLAAKRSIWTPKRGSTAAKYSSWTPKRSGAAAKCATSTPNYCSATPKYATSATRWSAWTPNCSSWAPKCRGTTSKNSVAPQVGALPGLFPQSLPTQTCYAPFILEFHGPGYRPTIFMEFAEFNVVGHP